MKIFILDWSVPDQYDTGFERTSSRKLFITRELALVEKRKLEDAVKTLGMSDISLRVHIMEVEAVE